MAQSLEKDIAWFEKEIADCKSTIAKVERGAGAATSQHPQAPYTLMAVHFG